MFRRIVSLCTNGTQVLPPVTFILDVYGTRYDVKNSTNVSQGVPFYELVPGTNVLMVWYLHPPSMSALITLSFRFCLISFRSFFAPMMASFTQGGDPKRFALLDREPVLLAIALCEAYRVSVGWANPVSEQFNALKENYTPGTLGFDVSRLHSSQVIRWI